MSNVIDKKTLLCSLGGVKKEDIGEDTGCFYLDFGSKGGSVTISSNTLTSFNYSFDEQQWNAVSPGGTVNVGSGKVYLCAASPVTSLFSSDSYSNAWSISGSDVKAGGNINTLLNADSPNSVAYSAYTFACLFYDCDVLTQAPALPATTLADYCYRYMFSYCTGLTQAPKLPATTLAISCYGDMFRSCTGLTQAPKLPATTLAESCYE